MDAKERKQRLQEQEIYEAKINENRRFLTSHRWGIDTATAFMTARAEQKFRGLFKLNGRTGQIFDLLCAYVSEDPSFASRAITLGSEDPSLGKGILLTGGVGSGKTWMMQLFNRNQRQVFQVVPSKKMTQAYHQAKGVDGMAAWMMAPALTENDPNTFYQKFLGLCIDDMGSEDVVNNFGTKGNIIGDLIEHRYGIGLAGPLLHATTNMSGDQMDEFYGPRVTSRLIECMNFIYMGAEDRRK